MTIRTFAVAAAVSLTALGLNACGGSTPTPQTAAPSVVINEGPSAAVVGGWPHKWCDVVDGSMDREQVERIMGTPTSSHPDQDSWDAFGYDFTAFYDESGKVRQLDSNDLGLSEAQKAKLGPGCETRAGY